VEDMGGPGFDSPQQHIFLSLESYLFIASEAPTENAANVNMLDLSVAYEVQFIQYEP
jgi:hypothetical protein